MNKNWIKAQLVAHKQIRASMKIPTDNNNDGGDDDDDDDNDDDDVDDNKEDADANDYDNDVFCEISFQTWQ